MNEKIKTSFQLIQACQDLARLNKNREELYEKRSKVDLELKNNQTDIDTVKTLLAEHTAATKTKEVIRVDAEVVAVVSVPPEGYKEVGPMITIDYLRLRELGR